MTGASFDTPVRQKQKRQQTLAFFMDNPSEQPNSMLFFHRVAIFRSSRIIVLGA
ncbi:hypothetical protein [Dickeya fangzhongdai]